MRRYVKYAAYALIAAAVIVLLCGCHAQYCFTIEIDSGSASNDRIDVLIPLDEENEEYRDVSYTARNVYGEDDEWIAQTEIARYSLDGYRSMLVHYRVEEYEISSYDDTKDVVRFYLNSEREFLGLCDSCETFRIAVVDRNGNVLQVSPVYAFKSSAFYYLEKPLEYDVAANTASPKYERNGFITIWELLASLFSVVMPIPAAALLIAAIAIRCKDASAVPKVYHSFIFMILCVPSAAAIAFRIDDAVKSTLTRQAAWDKFWDLGSTSVTYVLYTSLPLVIYFAFTIWTAVELLRRRA